MSIPGNIHPRLPAKWIAQDIIDKLTEIPPEERTAGAHGWELAKEGALECIDAMVESMQRKYCEHLERGGDAAK